MKILRLILGDQLNYQHSWFSRKDPEVLYLMMEIRQETDYVLHHAQKILAFFGAMRAFAEYIKSCGHQVAYLKITDPENRQNLPDNLDLWVKRWRADRVEYLEPDEYRLDQQLKMWAKKQKIPVVCLSAEHFLTGRHDFAHMFEKSDGPYIMERFYRKIRRKYHLMLDSHGKPWGGRWNFDKENRHFFKGGKEVPPVWESSAVWESVWRDIEVSQCQWFGEVKTKNLGFPQTRQEALNLLNHFLRWGLPHFGTFQDSMNEAYPFLWHSRLSFALNVKMLHPMEVVQAALQAYQSSQDRMSLSQLEGFVRQIVGWREFMRGIYWKHMPAFATLNFFGHERPLPSWYWNGRTRMHCLHVCIRDSLRNAYAHHIQRLMITGAFCLLAGVYPDEVDRWYLGIYADAVEWVQITNTRGMSQYADGGLTATKPYVGSATYINRMSDYCSSCYYDPHEKFGPRACPWNALFWNFFIQHREKLQKNPRLGPVYRNLNRMPQEMQGRLVEKAGQVLEDLEKI